MINKLRLKNFSGLCSCQFNTYQSIESSIQVNYDFFPGNVYGIVGDFGMGAWALSECIAGNKNSMWLHGGIYLDDNIVSKRELAELSTVITQCYYKGINSHIMPQTAEICIEKSLRISQLPFRAKDIKSIFNISDERYQRNIKYVSGEIWNISAAIGFCLKKSIFCFPWLNDMFFAFYESMYQHGIIDFLKRHDKIILVPTGKPYKIASMVDYVLDITDAIQN